MKNMTRLALAAVLVSSLLTGCAHFSFDPAALLGLGMSDLENAKETGKEKLFPLNYNEAFNKVLEILKDYNLSVFQANRKYKYIVATGFEKQINTTRVGIFFEDAGNNQTRITLSSLSRTAVSRAEEIIFGVLSGKAPPKPAQAVNKDEAEGIEGFGM